MRDWRLTWWPVCNPKAVAEQGNAKTKFVDEQDINWP